MMVVSPTIHSAQIDNLTQTRKIYNSMTNMLDKICDDGQVTNVEIEDFYLEVASAGLPVDIDITRKVKVINPDGKGGTYYVFTYTDNINNWNKGDACVISVKQIANSASSQLVYNLTHLYTKTIDVQFAGRVRN